MEIRRRGGRPGSTSRGLFSNVFFVFVIISMLCALLIPGIFLYFASQIVVGPLLWVGRSLRLQEHGQRLLQPGRALPLQPTKALQVRSRLNQIALTSWSPRARDFVAEEDDLQVLVRTQPRTVGPDGEPLRFPWTRKERSEAQQVLGLAVVIDTKGRLPANLDLHVALGRDDAVVGDEALAIALLDHGVRRHSRPGDQLTISETLLGYDSPLAIHQAEPDELIAQLVRMTRRLLDALDDDGRVDRARLLLHNIRHDEAESVRAKSVDMLLGRFAKHRESTLAVALVDTSPAVRFAAARHLGDEGFDVVLAVLNDPSSSDGLQERALRYLIRHFPPSKIIGVLKDIVCEGDSGKRNIAIRHLGELRHAPAIDWMQQIVATSDHRTTVDIATALADIGRPESEPILLKLLSTPNLDVQLAAVDALGSVGRIGVVERLLPFSRSRLTDARLQLAASTAIRMIQARRARTGSGALSVVQDSAAGSLSVTAPSGAVSETHDESSAKLSS